MNYPTIRNLLASVFSVDVGLTSNRENEVLADALNEPAYRAQLENELRRAFADEQLSWMELLGTHNVYPADDESDARRFVEERIWNLVFDSRPGAP